MIVMKFGGTSVGSIDAFAQVVQIVAQRVTTQAQTTNPGVVVVTSAMSSVTNMLIDAAHNAATGDDLAHEEIANALLVKHQTISGHFIDDGTERAAVGFLLEERLRQFKRLCSSIAVLGELTDRGLDVVSGLGEQMSAPLLAAVLRSQGVAAEAIDARDLVVTDEVHGGAEPLMAETAARCQERLAPLIAQGIVPVITGFIGTSKEGLPTTLGRGGSDYSAAILGSVLNADEIEIWTDVNGVMTADPRVVNNARSLNQLSYEEIAELAYYGAKVLHPKTVKPAIAKKIPVRVLNTFNPDHPGTRIAEHSTQPVQGGVKAVTAIRKLNLITVAGRGMIGVPGTAARTFSSVARTGANVLMISQSSSEQSICFVVPDNSAPIVVDALQAEFKGELERGYIDEIDDLAGIVIVAVVGSAMRGIPGLAAGIFRAAAQKSTNVIAIAQGSSEANVSFVVEEAGADDVVRSIHELFELDKPAEERAGNYLL